MFLLLPHLKAASWHLELWVDVVKTAPGHWILSDSLNDGVWPWWLHVKWTNCNHKPLNDFLQRTYLSSHHPAQINNRNLYASLTFPHACCLSFPLSPKVNTILTPVMRATLLLFELIINGIMQNRSFCTSFFHLPFCEMLLSLAPMNPFLLLYSILSHDYSKIYVSIFRLQTINKITFELLCMRASCFSLCNPMDCSPPDSSVHGILQARILEWVTIPISRGGDLPDPGIEPRSPALQADSLPSEPPGKLEQLGIM